MIGLAIADAAALLFGAMYVRHAIKHRRTSAILLSSALMMLLLTTLVILAFLTDG